MDTISCAGVVRVGPSGWEQSRYKKGHRIVLPLPLPLGPSASARTPTSFSLPCKDPERRQPSTSQGEALLWVFFPTPPSFFSNTRWASYDSTHF